MGYAARAKTESRQALTPTVDWRPCEVCGNTFPTAASPDPIVKRFDVCQRCYVADLAELMRRNYETVRMLPTVRILAGKQAVYPIFPPNIRTVNDREVRE